MDLSKDVATLIIVRFPFPDHEPALNDVDDDAGVQAQLFSIRSRVPTSFFRDIAGISCVAIVFKVDVAQDSNPGCRSSGIKPIRESISLLYIRLPSRKLMDSRKELAGGEFSAVMMQSASSTSSNAR